MAITIHRKLEHSLTIQDERKINFDLISAAI